jgi:hypothetical protein
MAEYGSSGERCHDALYVSGLTTHRSIAQVFQFRMRSLNFRQITPFLASASLSNSLCEVPDDMAQMTIVYWFYVGFMTL